MLETSERRGHPKLKELVSEATRALSHLDADRLEELALSCQALNRALTDEDAAARAAVVFEAKDATGDMAVFARVLEATRANLNVMSRLRELRAGRLEYGDLCPGSGLSQTAGWRGTESGHGDN